MIDTYYTTMYSYKEVMLLCIPCLLLLPLFVGVLCMLLVLLCSTLCKFLFAIIQLGKSVLVASFLLYSGCYVADIDLCLFLAVAWVGVWCVIVAFISHTHLLFDHTLKVSDTFSTIL